MPTKKPLIFAAFALNIGLTVFGFTVLLDSPYTGIRMDVCGDRACVQSVDEGSPADQTVKNGDILEAVAGEPISSFAFHPDPDYIRFRKDQLVFWKAQQKLSEVVVKGRPVNLHVERAGRRVEARLTPVHYPFRRALAKTLPLYLVGWTFIVVSYLVLRRKEHEISVANFLIGTFACTSFVSLAPYSVRDIAFPFVPFKALSVIDYVHSQAFSYALFHMLLIFPRRKESLNRRPWLIFVPYSVLGLVLILHFAGAFENTYITSYVSMNVCLLSYFGRMLYEYVKEKNALYKRQIQWVVLGSAIGIASWAGMTSLPLVFGASFISQELSVLPTVIYPLSFAFAVTKYRLMDIEGIFDRAVVYGFTIAILAGVETTFLSFTSPHVLATGKGLPYFSVIAVLLIVFIYVPVRNAVKGMVERLFKRGKYDPEKELRQFMVRLGLCDERSALEKFTAFVKDLFRPSGVIIIKIEDKSASLLHANSGGARIQGNAFLSQVDAVWEHVRKRGTCTFGYELAEKGLLDGPAPDPENALFVPFITDPADVKSGYLAVLLKKWNETAYSIKDVTLLNAISVNIANIIEAGELRKERAEIENRFRKEKDAVMKELHDGLGNVLTSITVTSQAGERVTGEATKGLLGRIEEYSLEAMNFLRTGLTVLDNPHGELGAIMEAVKDRFSDAFESAGTELCIECTEEAGRLRPGAKIALNLARIIQEALTNIIKHAGARRARIDVVRTRDGLAVTVTDDGKGFDAGEKRAGYGLANMRRRIEDIGGTFAVESSPGKGAEIRFAVPAAGKEGGRAEYALGDR